MKTETQVILPILGCLKAAEEYLQGEVWQQDKDRKPIWTPVNDQQKEFLEDFMRYAGLVDSLGDNLKRKAHCSVEVINAWLKENGFDIQLSPPPPGSRTFAVASILDVLVEWIEKGSKTTIHSADTHEEFRAVKLKKGNGVSACEAKGHPNPVVSIRTKSSDTVCMTVLDRMPEGTFGVAKKVEELRSAQREWIPSDGVVFPMVDYDSQVDISWIVNMRTGDRPDDFRIEEAIQQTKFRMNEQGARAESAAAMTFRCLSIGGPDKTIYIDRPFMLWIEREGIVAPLFTGVFAEDSWKEPKGLE